MACAQAVVGVVDQMPGVVHGVGEIGCALLDGMAVVAVEARLVDEVERQLAGLSDKERAVVVLNGAVGRGGEQHGTEMYALVGVADGVARHRQLFVGGFCAVGHERAEGQSDVDGLWCGTRDAHGDDLVGMRGEVFAAVGDAATRVAVAAQRAVEVELAAVVRRRSLVEIIDAQGAQRLVIL